MCEHKAVNMHADADLDVEPSCLADLNDDLLRKIASRLAESDLASAVALKRCSSRFKDLATPLWWQTPFQG